MTNYGRQSISDEDIQAVVDVLKSEYLTQGPKVPEFESALSGYLGAAFTILVSNATSALHLACKALGLGKGDILWTTPNSFVASANCALYCGASVNFVDICPESGSMSMRELEVKLFDAKRNGTLPKIVIPVHFSGSPAEMETLGQLKAIYGFKLIEDASHALGARILKTQVGACEFSDATVFSFHPVKMITTGEGGAVTTQDPEIAMRLRLLRSHGITSDRNYMLERPALEIWNYQMVDLGMNYRMTEIQAALGLSQLKRIEYFVERRNQIAKRYDEALEGLGLQLPIVKKGYRSSYHLYCIRVDSEKAPSRQKRLYEHLWGNGIKVNLHYIPIHRQPYYEKLGFRSGQYPESEKFHRESISLPIYVDLTAAQQEKIIDLIKKFAK